MKHSQDKILTTHVGSLPRPRDMLLPLHARESGLPYDAAALEKEIDAAVANAVQRQVDLGIDIINDGEHGRASFATYANTRIGGLERLQRPPAWSRTASTRWNTRSWSRTGWRNSPASLEKSV